MSGARCQLRSYPCSVGSHLFLPVWRDRSLGAREFLLDSTQNDDYTFVDEMVAMIYGTIEGIAVTCDASLHPICNSSAGQPCYRGRTFGSVIEPAIHRYWLLHKYPHVLHMGVENMGASGRKQLLSPGLARNFRIGS